MDVADARAEALARRYRRFAEQTTPVQGRLASAISRSRPALRALATTAGSSPALILAVLHDLALSGAAPALADAYAAGDPVAAAAAGVSTLVEQVEQVRAVARRRGLRTLSSQRGAVLYPAVAEIAHRAAAEAVGLVELGDGADLDVQLDRIGIDYGDGRMLGDPSSPLQLRVSMVGAGAVPDRALPEVVGRFVVDVDPVDLSDPDEVRWLRACRPPDPPDHPGGGQDGDRRDGGWESALEAAAEAARARPPQLVRGDPLVGLVEAVARVPRHALPVVTTCWRLSQFRRDDRQRFRQLLEEAAATRPVAWVSLEGVGVAPGISTFGDRPASGHSIVGLTLLEASGAGSGRRRSEAVGRCWSRGRLLAWLADSPGIGSPAEQGRDPSADPSGDPSGDPSADGSEAEE